MTKNEIFEQAQVFANALSLVGSRFDSGDGIDYANKEEERLGEMIDELVKERDEYAACAYTMAAAHKVERDDLRSTINAACISAIRQEREIDVLKDAARLALDALIESVDMVRSQYEECANLYSPYPSRAARIAGYKRDAELHVGAIAALKAAL